MPVEREEFEEKSRYEGSERERLRVLKTILAMANSGGGTILIHEVTAGLRGLDSASIDAFVNSYVGPQLYGLSSEQSESGEVTIHVPDSENSPHIVVREGKYRDDQGREKWALHSGQIWVRHGSQNQPANADDIQRLTQRRAGRLIEEIGARVQQPGFVLGTNEDAAQPVRIGGDSNAPRLRADPRDVYPHTRRSLADELDRPMPWIHRAVKALGLEDDQELAHTDRNASDKPIFWRYSEEARRILVSKVEEDPEWNP